MDAALEIAMDYLDCTGQGGGKQGAERSIGTAMMEYRNIEFTVVQGIERRVWKWSASVAGVVIMGNEQDQQRWPQPRRLSIGL